MLLLLHLDLGGRADVDDGHAAGELGEALLELLAVVVAGGLLDLGLDLGLAVVDVLLLARAFDDRGVVLVDLDRLGLAELGQVGALELEAELLADDLAAGEDGDVLEHGLAAVAEAGRLDGAGGQGAAEVVDDERGQGLAVDVLGDDDERLAGLGDLLEHGEHVLHVRDLLVVDEDEGVLEDRGHRVAVGDEVGADVAAVELHALDVLDGGVHGLGLLHRDDAVLADLLHGVGDLVADLHVVVGGDRGDVGDLVLLLDLLGILLDLLDGELDGLVDAALEAHRIHAGGDGLEAFLDHGVGEDGGGGGAVAGDVVGLGGDFLEELGAHVLVGVLELDFLGDGDAVLGDGRGAELLVEEDVASLRAEGDLDGLRDLLDAGQELPARVLAEHQLLRHFVLLWNRGVSAPAPPAEGPDGAGNGRVSPRR